MAHYKTDCVRPEDTQPLDNRTAQRVKLENTIQTAGQNAVILWALPLLFRLNITFLIATAGCLVPARWQRQKIPRFSMVLLSPLLSILIVAF